MLCTVMALMMVAMTQSITEPSTSQNSNRAGGSGPCSSPLGAEVRFQTAWVAYLWSRAAGAGVVPHLSARRAEQWAYNLHHQEQHWQPQGGGAVGAAHVAGIQMRLLADLQGAMHEVTQSVRA